MDAAASLALSALALSGLSPVVAILLMAAAAAAAATGSTCRFCSPRAPCRVILSSCTVGVVYKWPPDVCSTALLLLSQLALQLYTGGTSARPLPTGPAASGGGGKQLPTLPCYPASDQQSYSMHGLWVSAFACQEAHHTACCGVSPDAAHVHSVKQCMQFRCRTCHACNVSTTCKLGHSSNCRSPSNCRGNGGAVSAVSSSTIT